jgi:glycosyltransferase involved in cell wall biosynthesis
LKICLILEGSYPYVRGGVSTWVDSFIRGLPEHEFVLWTINDLEEKKGQFAYDLPENVVSVLENFISSSLNLRIRKKTNLKLNKAEKEALQELIKRGNPNWQALLDSIGLHPGRPVEFFLSNDFLDMLKDLSETEFQYAGFKDLFWTIRSMFLPLLYIMSREIPQADLYHSPSTGYAGVMGALASMKYDKPFVVTEHGIYTREREEELLRSDWIIPYFKELWISTFYLFSRVAYEQAHQVTSLYQKASLIQQELGCDPDKCNIIGNGLNLAPLEAIPLKSNDGWIDIAAIVRFAQIKDIKTMIYTFSQLKQEIPNTRLHILGGIDDEQYYQECLDLINFLNVDDIIIPGTVDILDYLEKIDFTILTSLSEGQPFAILESLAARRPVISTDVGSCRELIEGGQDDHLGEAGICVPPMQQVALLQALRTLCREESTREKMGEIGHQRVKHFYNRPEMLQKYQQVYEKAKKLWQE